MALMDILKRIQIGITIMVKDNRILTTGIGRLTVARLPMLIAARVDRHSPATLEFLKR